MQYPNIFTAVPAQRCPSHQDYAVYPKNSLGYLSCPCGLADAGCYMIVWSGPGLGIVCDNKEDGERKAHLMNEAWYLSKGVTIDELVLSGL